MIASGVSDHSVSGAALVIDGRVVAEINAERLARMKMVMGFPWKLVACRSRKTRISRSARRVDPL